MDKLFTLTALSFYGICAAGVVIHATKKWMMGEINYSLLDYFLRVDPRGTVVTFATAFAVVVSAIGSGQISSVHLFSDVSTAFLAGYACDSAIYPANRVRN